VKDQPALALTLVTTMILSSLQSLESVVEHGSSPWPTPGSCCVGMATRISTRLLRRTLQRQGQRTAANTKSGSIADRCLIDQFLLVTQVNYAYGDQSDYFDPHKQPSLDALRRTRTTRRMAGAAGTAVMMGANGWRWPVNSVLSMDITDIFQIASTND